LQEREDSSVRSFTVSLLGLALVTATICACSGGGSSNVPAPLTPTQRNVNGAAPPSAPLSALGKTIESNADIAATLPATSVIKVSPASVALVTSAQTQTITVSESGYSGSFTVTSSNPAIATVSPVVSGQATVTAVAQGSTSLLVSDQLKHKVTVPVTVGLAQLVLEQFRSPATQSITINANGQTTYVNLASAPSGCTSFSVSCSVTAPEIVGANTFRLSTTDGQNGTGNLLSIGAVSAQITSPSSPQKFSVPLGGAVSALTIALGNPTPPPGTPTTSSVNITALDADHNPISGTASYVNSSGVTLSVSIADSDKSGITSVKPKTVSKPSTIPVLSYTGAPILPVTITASAPGITPVAALFAPSGVAPTITEYPLPTAPINNGNNSPAYIAAGSDGALWFTQVSDCQLVAGPDPNVYCIGRITTSGAVTEYPISPSGYGTYGYGITSGPDGALWFTQLSSIGRIATNGSTTQFLPPAAEWSPVIDPGGGAITTGPDKALWFGIGEGLGGGPIGRMTTGGTFSFHPANMYSGTISGAIVTGPDRNIWFTESGGIGKITVSGSITSYPVGGYPYGIAAGPDGALWFTDENTIGRITTSGSITTYLIPSTIAPSSNQIAVGPDGALWFTEGNANNIGRITTGGSITQYPIPTANAEAGGIVAGPDGAMWFTEYGANKIGRMGLP
jgi:streptogramin lyase